VNQPVLSGRSLIGKIIEAGPGVSKVLLITDPNSKIGVIIQRTRQQGILYGTFAGECRIKYLSVDAEIKAGDTVESAGYGGYFPKALWVGAVARAWKEPGQIYQVAEIKPATDLSRVEEVVCLV
jgi:rod shape-determining protein MreC